MVHSVCGSSFEPVLRCARCHDAAAVDDVRTEPGPSGGFPRSVPVGANRRRAGRSAGSGPGMFPETMALIGSRWSSAVLGAAFLGATRFTDFERALGAPPSIVIERLRSFVGLGVLEPRTGTYHLTAKGRAFFPVVATFLAWGERWRPAPDGPAIVATHRTCGGPFVPELACSSCTGTLSGPTVHADPSDLAPAPFAAVD
jgi:DNA-binding HxlR family transcriptional regulator